MLTPREANHLFFVNKGVANLQELVALKNYLHMVDIDYVEYHEGHYDEITAIATFPLPEEYKEKFRDFPLIRL